MKTERSFPSPTLQGLAWALAFAVLDAAQAVVFGNWLQFMDSFQVGFLVFALTTMAIAVPTGVKIFNWVGTLYKGQLLMRVPMLFALSFLPMFAIGGLTGLPLGLSASDIQLHDTYYVIGHFHYVVAPGTIRTAIFEENQRRGALIDPEGAYGALSGRIEKQLLEAAASAPGPEIVGRRIAELLREPAPPLRTIVGGPARAVSTLRRVVPDGLFASGMRRLLGL